MKQKKKPNSLRKLGQRVEYQVCENGASGMGEMQSIYFSKMSIFTNVWRAANWICVYICVYLSVVSGAFEVVRGCRYEGNATPPKLLYFKKCINEYMYDKCVKHFCCLISNLKMCSNYRPFHTEKLKMRFITCSRCCCCCCFGNSIKTWNWNFNEKKKTNRKTAMRSAVFHYSRILQQLSEYIEKCYEWKITYDLICGKESILSDDVSIKNSPNSNINL